ncbi:MAG TPA: dihydrodipicolinate synthase family protein, partial [Planctomycetota bacterium]|nr:dihydrodipicolinate synthase family protein [Planctomycetota bacterium]
MKVNWKGVYPAATTAFTRDQIVDLAATAAHCDALIRAGMHGLVMLGTVGENHSLEYAEKLDVLRTAVEAAGGRVPVLAGVAQNTT